MSEWRPIETAPKQVGCEILVTGINADGDRYTDIVSWQGEWCSFHPEDDAYAIPTQDFTHWMPLPEPPK